MGTAWPTLRRSKVVQSMSLDNDVDQLDHRRVTASGKIPIDMPTDREAICLRSDLRKGDSSCKPVIAWIRNTPPSSGSGRRSPAAADRRAPAAEIAGEAVPMPLAQREICCLLDAIHPRTPLSSLEVSCRHTATGRSCRQTCCQRGLPINHVGEKKLLSLG